MPLYSNVKEFYVGLSEDAIVLPSFLLDCVKKAIEFGISERDAFKM